MALDTTVKIFSSTQLGAPTLNNTAGTLIAVLDACLVNGFGLKTCDSVVIASGVGTANISTGHSMIEQGVALFAGATGSYSGLNGERKVLSAGTSSFTFDASGLADGTVTGTVTAKVAGAGWVKAFSGTNLAAYKSGNVAATGHCLRVDDTTTTYATVRGYEVMTSIDAGTGIFPTATQQATNVWFKADSATASAWSIIANDRFIYPLFTCVSSYRSYGNVLYWFGDAVSRKAGDAYRSTLAAQSTTSAPSPGSSSWNFNATALSGTYLSRYCSRSYTALGSPAAIAPTWFDAAANSNGMSGCGGRTWPNPEDNGIVFTPIVILEGTGYRGELPGIFATPQSIGAGISDGSQIPNASNYAHALIYKAFYANTSSVSGLLFDATGPWSA